MAFKGVKFSDAPWASAAVKQGIAEKLPSLTAALERGAVFEASRISAEIDALVRSGRERLGE